MTFTRKSASLIPIKDTVFAVAAEAARDRAQNGPDVVYDATIGSLYGEDGELVAYDNVYDHYDQIAHTHKARYAASFTGNADFRQAVYQWALRGRAASLAHTAIATPGGSGAVFMAIRSTLEEGQTLLIPDICWGSYSLMAAMYNLGVERYEMFESDHFNLASVEEKIQKLQETQDHITLVINDPCHNPTGYSMSSKEWAQLIDLLNKASLRTPITLIDDIAYIDYAYSRAASRDYMEHFSSISSNVLIVVALSASKTLSYYGMRCGAAIALAQKPEDVRSVEIVFEKTARATWSSIPNAAMENFVWVINENLENYEKEKQPYVDLLQKRSSLFLKEAKAAGLSCYPYKEGFFVTVHPEKNVDLDKYHDALMKEHIYTVLVNKGIRVAVCSLPVKKIYGLAGKMKAVLDNMED